jgi:hypothetical protein
MAERPSPKKERRPTKKDANTSARIVWRILGESFTATYGGLPPAVGVKGDERVYGQCAVISSDDPAKTYAALERARKVDIENKRIIEAIKRSIRERRPPPNETLLPVEGLEKASGELVGVEDEATEEIVGGVRSVVRVLLDITGDGLHFEIAHEEPPEAVA